ncbi:hypothetical protein Bhyg_07346 [Pseudolycoriella hygida]|uniref:Uncharacterized protein n=1 Tax=Pseudolycoriella hygida TaxID=35572 RepID=A0A9Q0N2J0_9DIPT|nr:hypothetical protein Bhyg_07346 [Pseudolycoriella hygida]
MTVHNCSNVQIFDKLFVFLPHFIDETPVFWFAFIFFSSITSPKAFGSLFCDFLFCSFVLRCVFPIYNRNALTETISGPPLSVADRQTYFPRNSITGTGNLARHLARRAAKIFSRNLAASNEKKASGLNFPRQVCSVFGQKTSGHTLLSLFRRQRGNGWIERYSLLLASEDNGL